MNSIISYPRSGRTLTEQRLRLIIYLLTGDDHNRTIEKYIHLTHGGFDVRFGPDPDGLLTNQTEENGISYILLRDAKAVVNSFYYQTIFARRQVLQRRGLFKGIPLDQTEFIKSPWGVDRYCLYLNAVSRYKKTVGGRVEFLFYEDLIEKRIIPNLAKLLGFSPGDLSRDQIDFVYDNTHIDNVRSGNVSQECGLVRKWILGVVSSDGERKNSCAREGSVDNYKKTLPENLQAYINKRVEERCSLGEYWWRYIK